MLKKMLLFISVFFCIMGITFTVHAKIDSKSIVAVWLCDEGSGGEVKDSSGNGHDGKIVGDVKWIDGKFEKALQFSGNASSRVEIPHEDSLTLDSWTITAWAKLSPPPGGDWAVILVKDPANGVQNYALDMDEGGMLCSEVTSGGNWSGCNSNTPVYDDNWHFCAASYDGTALRAYVDGEKKAEQIFGKPDTNTAPVAIGGRMNNSQPLMGLVDDIGLFSAALEIDDIKTIKDKGLGDALGISPVEPAAKLATTWGQVKN